MSTCWRQEVPTCAEGRAGGRRHGGLPSPLRLGQPHAGLMFLAARVGSGARGPASEQFGVSHCGLGLDSDLQRPAGGTGRVAAQRGQAVLVVPWPGGPRCQTAGTFLRRLDKTVPSHVLWRGCQHHSDMQPALRMRSGV